MVPEFAKKVAPVYKLLGWEWSPEREEPHIPDGSEIAAELNELIDDLTQGNHDGRGTGGLYVHYSLPDKYESGSYGLSLTIKAEEHFDRRIKRSQA